MSRPVPPPSSIPDVVAIHDYGHGTPSLLLETPHGATDPAHFERLRAELRGTFPEGLEDFFFVNTDVGSFELADRIATLFVEADPTRAARVVRSLIPRTFIDCNRLIEATGDRVSADPGVVTPGMHAYVRDPDDRALLLTRHRQYVATASAAYEETCTTPGGRALMIHSYAPRSLQIDTGDDVVKALHREYAPERIENWPLRDEIDLIVDTPEGERLGDAGLTDALREAGKRAGYEVAVCGTYALHPGTYARVFAERYPGRTLCVEFRRDLLVPEFTPFAPMRGEPEKVERAARAVAVALEGD